MKHYFYILLSLAVAGALSVVADSNKTSTTSSPSQCAQQSKNCDACVKIPKCVYCNQEKLCKEVLSQGFFNEGQVCKGGLMQASWVTCSVNMMALIIGMGVVGGVLIISVCACICCCCCCKDSAKQKLKWMRQDAATARRSEERKAQYAERRAERQAKNDEIRKKYGLFKGDQGGYQRMEDGE